ncbi:glycosyltransferase family 4 protein [Stutzerimonas nitrititolerans]|uniref:glycosyltransferase family 4 protein n=1 Tax=Stutzerimonas nitrititolerans TaxID=2482751 RepID=UPI0028AD0256|nr:glycosyltransferase family 4 protein [Stutzerimonas nitrititolerans]
MKVLMLTTKFPVDNESPWLTSELAAELIKRNVSVDVMDIQWAGQEGVKNYRRPGLNVIRKKPFDFKFLGKAGFFIKWFFSSFKLYPYLIWKLLSVRRYDLLICYSPCVILAGAIPLARLLSKKSILIYWDFFPTHIQHATGRFPKFSIPLLRRLEGCLVSSFSRASFMSPANLRFANYYFGVSLQTRDVIPIWSAFLGWDNLCKETERLGSPYGDEVLVVFGGQLVAGRGVEVVLSAVRIARISNPKIKLLVCGAGPLAIQVKEFSSGNPEACDYLGLLPRQEYLKILAYSDIGVVATMAGVESPTYPSKSLDYMASCMPIAACVENSTDFGEIIESNGFGCSCKEGDIEKLAEILIQLSLDPLLRKNMGMRALNFLRKEHAVSDATDKILRTIDI